ncbi:GNAT family N-acetyltransferase [Salinisphaera orenii]|uniref:GNAT family N-acetyltransferase n=1 Tax=Salinisphaera orenii TaxID=856731 RepID=UPI0018C89D68
MTTVDRIDNIPPSEWNALLTTAQPFIRHEFLAALEASGSVGPGTGWQPRHLILRDTDGHAAAAAPIYEKQDSFGEFVFDFAWANAYRQCGLAYYPKLVAAVPYTPVTGPRLLARDADTRRQLAAALARLVDGRRYSSAHVLFTDADDRTALAAATDEAPDGLINAPAAAMRRGCQYRWYNRGYATFDTFLAQLSSKRRKQIRRERRELHAAGVRIEVRHPHEISAELWSTLYSFYDRTYAVRGQDPYLTPAFFDELAARMPDQTLFFIAFHGHDPVGMAFMMCDKHALYGRHWGCHTDYLHLHFETCYYAAIDYCIANNLAFFDAGVQGEHKIRRGFEPFTSWSAHAIANPTLRSAIVDFVERESALVADHEAEERARSSFPNAQSTQNTSPT